MPRYSINRRVTNGASSEPPTATTRTASSSRDGSASLTRKPLLERHRAAQQEERLAAANVWQDHGLVFTQANGRPIDPRSDNRAWKALLAAAGVRPARLHDARHTAATVMLAMGVPPRVAMQLLGHSQISLTLGTYSPVVPELADDAARRIGEGLWS